MNWPTRNQKIDVGLAVLAVVKRRENCRVQLSFRDMAEVCGCSHQVLRNLEQRAIQTLRRKLLQKGITER